MRDRIKTRKLWKRFICEIPSFINHPAEIQLSVSFKGSADKHAIATVSVKARA